MGWVYRGRWGGENLIFGLCPLGINFWIVSVGNLREVVTFTFGMTNGLEGVVLGINFQEFMQSPKRKIYWWRRCSEMRMIMEDET